MTTTPDTPVPPSLLYGGGTGLSQAAIQDLARKWAKQAADRDADVTDWRKQGNLEQSHINRGRARQLDDCGADLAAALVDAAGPLPLAIVVYGKPATQGSKQARPIYKGRGDARVFTGRVAQVESSKEKHKAWRTAVKDAARQVLDGAPRIEDRPVRLEIVYCFDKPKSAPKHRRTWPITRSSGDVDKLLRATFDALTDAGVYKDDSQIIHVTASKHFTDDPDAPLTTPGAVIRIWEVH